MNENFLTLTLITGDKLVFNSVTVSYFYKSRPSEVFEFLRTEEMVNAAISYLGIGMKELREHQFMKIKIDGDIFYIDEDEDFTKYKLIIC